VSFVAVPVIITGILAVLAVPAVGGAQTSAGRSKLTVTVSDPSGAVIPAATVTVVGLEPATKAAVAIERKIHALPGGLHSCLMLVRGGG
jgi:hypothetical protein